MDFRIKIIAFAITSLFVIGIIIAFIIPATIIPLGYYKMHVYVLAVFLAFAIFIIAEKLRHKTKIN